MKSQSTVQKGTGGLRRNRIIELEIVLNKNQRVRCQREGMIGEDKKKQPTLSNPKRRRKKKTEKMEQKSGL